MNRYAGLCESSYNFCKFNLASKRLKMRVHDVITYCVMNTEQTSENVFTYTCYNFHKTVRNSNWKK